MLPAAHVHAHTCQELTHVCDVGTHARVHCTLVRDSHPCRPGRSSCQDPVRPRPSQWQDLMDQRPLIHPPAAGGGLHPELNYVHVSEGGGGGGEGWKG